MRQRRSLPVLLLLLLCVSWFCLWNHGNDRAVAMVHGFAPISTLKRPTKAVIGREPSSSILCSAVRSHDVNNNSHQGNDGNANDNESNISNTAATQSSPSQQDTFSFQQSVLNIPPEDIELVKLSDNDSGSGITPPITDTSTDFVSMFRGSANYIANHRNTVAVIHIPGGLLEDRPSYSSSFFKDLMNDVALMWLLGMKPVLVVGCRYQIDQRLPGRRLRNGLAVTDDDTLRIVKEEAGYVRFEVERQLARCLRSQHYQHQYKKKKSNQPTSMSRSISTKATMDTSEGTNHNSKSLPLSGSSSSGAASSPTPINDGNVVSGNFFSAQPFGVLDGVDYRYTGFVRRVEADKIRRVHAANDICLLTPLGVSPSGEVYNVQSEALAAAVASALGASKVIYLTEPSQYQPPEQQEEEEEPEIQPGVDPGQSVVLRHRVFGNRLLSLRMNDAQNLLRHRGIAVGRGGMLRFLNNDTKENEQETETEKKTKKDDGEGDDNPKGDDTTTTSSSSSASASSLHKDVQDPDIRDMLVRIGSCVSALRGGVQRAHILSPTQGALLQELYTRDGSGTLISRDLYEGIRQTTPNAVIGIFDLIQPLVKAGTLVARPRATLDQNVEDYYVYTREDLVVACGQLKQFEDGFAELGCLVVRKEYRANGRGDSMLGYLERKCVELGKTKIFVLSTQTMEWFIERGFEAVTVDHLPPSRQATYNHERASKIYMKQIGNIRDLDASELWWNR